MATKQIPGPKLNLIFSTWRKLVKQPLNFLLEIHKNYPSIAHIKVFNRKLVLLTDPTLIRFVLQTNQKQYTKGSQYKFLKLILGNGLVTSEGDLWKRQRKLIQPAFHKQYINTLFDDMLFCTNIMMKEWDEYVKTEKELYLSDEMMKVTLRIISKTMLSTDVNSEAETIRTSLVFIGSQIAQKAMKPIQLPMWFPTNDNVEFLKSKKNLDKIIYKIIEEHRQSTNKRGDLLDMLIASKYEDTGECMPDDLLRDEIMTIFVAGHSTTATALAWTFYLISQNPEVYDKLKKEVDEVVGDGELTFQHLQQLRYTKNVFNESMRIYPPVWMIVRKAAEDNMVGDYLIEKDTDVLIPPYIVHHDATLWKDADKFIPERWDTEEVKQMDKFTYFPFAAGPRMCIGNNFALFEADIIIAKVIQKFDFKYLGEVPAEMEASTTLRIKNRMPMKLRAL
jgi:cytochrome P450